ncbi:hypothetical protein AFEL58S_00047 [Afipia felis]|jgi:ABC-type nickel/cobalt efflux system permease component RcnA
MNEIFFPSIMATGFVVAFAHAAIPTHWLPFVLAGRGQRWHKGKTLMVVVLCGSGHVLFTTVLGALVVWLGIETSKWTGNVFPWIAGGALILFGLYYLIRQVRGGGHGHHHFGGDHDHGKHGHNQASETKRVDTGHGVLLLEVFEDGVPPRFQVRAEGAATGLPRAAALSLETVRPGGARQTFSFAARDGYLESMEEIPEPHEFTASLSLFHGDHVHSHEVQFEEHQHAASPQLAATLRSDRRPSGVVKSDGAVIVGLFTLLTFSPCEGSLPVYLSGIAYGWMGFVVLSAVLALATIAGMVVFTWLTFSGMERLRLGFLERYESGILGALILFLGVGIIFLGF